MQATLFLLILFISSSTSIKINDSDMELSNKLDELFTFYKKKLEHSNNKTNLIQLIENDTKKLLSLNDGNKTNTSSSSSFIQTKQTSFDYLNSPPYVWFQIPSMNLGPTSRRGHSTVPADTFMIVFGGCYMESPCFNDLYFFEFQSQSWTSIETTGTIPSARQGHSAVLYGSTMWVYGGSSSEGYLNDLYSLNLETVIF